MLERKRTIDQILIGVDSGVSIIGEWKFRYNVSVQGIEAYNGNETVIEPQISNESFEKVAERLLMKLGY